MRWWLEAETWRRTEVQVDPDDFARVFAWAKDGQQATTEEVQRDAWIVGAEVPPHALAAMQPQLAPGEVVRHERFLALEIPSVEIAYGTPTRQQTIRLLGRRLFAPRRDVDQVMSARARLLSAITVLLVLAWAAIGAAFLGRGEYFASAETAALLGCAALAAVCLRVAAADATLRRRSSVVWFALAAAPAAAAGVFGVLAEPDIDDARRYVREGRIERALVELEALGPPTDRELAPVYADVRLSQLRAAPSAEEASQYLTEIPGDLPQHVHGLALVDEAWVQEAQHALVEERPGDVAPLIARASGSTQTTAAARSLLSQADLSIGRHCASLGDARCAFERAIAALERGNAEGVELRDETLQRLRDDAGAALAAAESRKNLEERVAALDQAESRLELLEQLEGPLDRTTAQLSKVRARLGDDRARLAEQRAREEARRARMAEKERKEAERARIAEEKKRQALERKAQRAAQRYEAEQRSCCKYCSRGKPCGDTCIAQNRVCHVGPGCAC
jgi:hypothetical protein